MGERYFIFGNPVAHSLSPVIYESICGFTAGKIETPPGMCPADLKKMIIDSGARYGNVTHPAKAILASIGRGDWNVRATGAANCFMVTDAGIVTGNTDGEGFVYACGPERIHLRNRIVIIIGMGATARSIALSLSIRGIYAIFASRHPETTERFGFTVYSHVEMKKKIHSLWNRNERTNILVINTAPAGFASETMDEKASHWLSELLNNGNDDTVVETLEISYASDEERSFGLSMLTGQALYNLTRFTSRNHVSMEMYHRVKELIILSSRRNRM